MCSTMKKRYGGGIEFEGSFPLLQDIQYFPYKAINYEKRRLTARKNAGTGRSSMKRLSGSSSRQTYHSMGSLFSDQVVLFCVPAAFFIFNAFKRKLKDVLQAARFPLG